jgi:cell division protein FtsZ
VIPGLINVDFADVRTIMTSAGSSLMGIGFGSGEGRASSAARAAIASPLLEVSIEGAKGILFNITGGPDLSMFEVDEAAKIVSGAADSDANIIFGAAIDEAMVDQVKITVIATGFSEEKVRAVETKEALESLSAVATAAEGNGKAEGEEDSEFDIPAFMRQR